MSTLEINDTTSSTNCRHVMLPATQRSHSPIAIHYYKAHRKLLFTRQGSLLGAQLLTSPTMASKQPQNLDTGPVSIDEFLAPLHINNKIVLELSREMSETFTHLSANSESQFLPTPISESLLRRVDSADSGRRVQQAPIPIHITVRETHTD